MMRHEWRLRAGLVAALMAVAAPAAAFMGMTRDQGRPVSLLTVHHDDRASMLIALGELAFKSSALLGDSNLACDTCHPDGAASRIFFFPGLSDKPGNIDVTSQVLTHIDDGFYNPLNIPSLIGARDTAPYGRDGRFETIGDFTLFAVAVEFAGPALSDLALDSLVAFQESLDFPDNPWLDTAGGLTGDAPAAAVRGAELFARPFPNDPQLSCASCHRPDNYFVDNRLHDVGTGRDGKAGKLFETPTLRDTMASWPYFHDGRYDTLSEVVAYFDAYFALGLDANQRRDLTAYLEVVGRGDPAPPPLPSDSLDLATAADLVELTLAAEDHFLTHLVIEQAHVELIIYRRGAPEAAFETVTEWIRGLRAIEPHVIREDYAAANAALQRFRSLIAAPAD